MGRTSTSSPSKASATPSGGGSSTGRWVRRIGPSAAARASSADRWPRGGPSLSPDDRRRLAEEEVGAVRELGELLRGRGVARVGQRRPVLRDAEPEGRSACSAGGGSASTLEARRREGRVRLVLAQVEGVVEHAVVPPAVGEARELGDAAGRKPDCALEPVVPRRRRRSARPRARGRPSGRGGSG